jgi:hypothetical protein
MENGREALCKLCRWHWSAQSIDNCIEIKSNEAKWDANGCSVFCSKADCSTENIHRSYASAYAAGQAELAVERDNWARVAEILFGWTDDWGCVEDKYLAIQYDTYEERVHHPTDDIACAYAIAELGDNWQQILEEGENGD